MVGPFKKGSVIRAQTFDNSVPFNLTVTNSELVARGSTADVYEGELALPGRATRRVALKVFTHERPGENIGVREQLIRRELRAARHVRYPRIISILGMATSDSHTVLISPFMKNGCMLDYLQAHSTADRNALVVQVAEAVDHLHTVHNLVHGDLKCENVLISDKGTALLADFGLSTFPHKARADSSLALYQLVARGGVRLGTPGRGGRHSTTLAEVRLRFTAAFAGPELLFMDASARLPSKSTYLDVYAFGMLMLQAFTGETPWKGCTFQTIVHKVYSGTIHPRPGPEASERGFIDAWWKVCLNCLEYDPEQRPTMQQVLTELPLALDAHLHGQRYLASLKRALAREESGLRIGISKLLWSSEHGRQWLMDHRLDLFDSMRSQAGAHYVTAPQSSRLPIEFRLFQSSFDRSSFVPARTLRPLSLLLGTSDGDQYYGSFPFELSLSQAVCTLNICGEDLIATGLADDSLRIWNLHNGSVLRDSNHRGHTAFRASCHAVSVQVSPTKMLLASGSRCRINLWGLEQSGFLRAGPVIHTGARDLVCALAISTYHGHVVAGFDNGAICVWDPATGQMTGEIGSRRTPRSAHAHSLGSRRVNALAFSPDHCMLISCLNNGILGLYEYSSASGLSRRIAGALRGHSDGVLSAAYAPDGRSVVSGSWDKSLRIWNVDSRSTKLVLDGHSGSVSSVAFAPTGRHVASASQDQTVRIWDAQSGEAICVLTGHTAWVRSVIFSPDGTRVVSGSDDGGVRIWDCVVLSDSPTKEDDDRS